MKLLSIKILLISGLVIGILTVGKSQELLLKDEAVKMALEYNYDIKVAKNNISIAENNTSLQNNRYLPFLSLNGGTNWSSTTLRNNSEGVAFNANGAVTRINSNIQLGYTIFDGLGRKYTFARNKNDLNLSELQARNIIEGAIVQIFFAYHEVARLTENKISQEETLDISKERLLRAEYGYEYGQSTQLDVLNAEVDVNTDSINYLTIVQELENAKRDLNLLLGVDVTNDFEVDTAVTYQRDVDIDAVINEALLKNVNILQAYAQMQNSEYDIKINQSGWIPRVDAVASYAVNNTNWEDNSFLADNTTFAPNVGLNLSWNIYDGGATNIRTQNAKIQRDNQAILKDRVIQQLSRDLNNAWTVYQTALFVLDAQKKNLETNQRNFDRTKEQQRLGQITNIVFRQAQVNLINARLSYNQAKYSAKNAEVALLQLSGNLLNTEF